ncbi:MAG: response regulator transcription factor [Bacteroidales bacterium]|nr:response regulator transcription factor [Bacteroidales bacterium]
MIRPLNIFLAEDEADLAIITKNYLLNHGFNITVCKEKEEALILFLKEKFDFIIIDTAFSNNEGIALASKLRKINKDVPIILIGTNTTHDDVISCLKMNIDDFLLRPFSIEELYLRIEIIMRRINVGLRNQHLFKIGKYTLDTMRHVLIFNGKEKKLTSKELDLLYLFYQHRNRIVERQLALKKVWNQENYFSARNMDVYIKRLRNMLCEDSDVQIENVHGVGYKLIIYGL